MTLGYFVIRDLYINCIIEYNFVNGTNQQSTTNDFTKAEISTLSWKNTHKVLTNLKVKLWNYPYTERKYTNFSPSLILKYFIAI